MKLELKHISPYLPYGLKIKTNNQIRTLSVATLTTTENSISNVLAGIGHKPLLRPLSDFEKVTLGELTKRFNCSTGVIQDVWSLIQKEKNIEYINYRTYLMMCENHVDFNGLIDAGLAIDLNTLNK